MTDLSARINWQAPWLAPYRALGEPLAAQWYAGLAVHQAFNLALAQNPLLNCPVRFVAQSALPEGQAYEAFIFESKQVPTRDNWHDFLNALMWLHYPQTKSRLNALQAEQISQHGVGKQRGRLRDALTLFDENSALLIACATAQEALQKRDWQRLFVSERVPLWRGAQVLLFGHALMEKLIQPYKAITAHTWLLPSLGMDCKTPFDLNLAKGSITEMKDFDKLSPNASDLCRASQGVSDVLLDNFDIASVDAYLAEDLQTDKLSQKPFYPLPVLGVPNWLAENAEASFYADETVFRPL